MLHSRASGYVHTLADRVGIPVGLTIAELAMVVCAPAKGPAVIPRGAGKLRAG